MAEMKYLDFDVAIEPSGEGYTARVFNSPVGQAAGAFNAPFSELELENFLLRVGRSRHAVRRIESPEMASAKAFGGRLFDSVFAGEVRGCLRSSMDEASRHGAGLRVRLHLTKAPALADLPWEFLYNANMNRFLSLSVETPLVRYLDLPERIRPLVVRPPLHVLMMISSPSDYPALDVERESGKMREALADLETSGLVTVERLEDATLSELQRRLRRSEYHIFHFVGHGGFDPQAEDGLLVMEDQDNRGRRVSAQFLGTLLHDHRPLRLAVLNACEGGRASRGDPFAGTAQSLVQQGIPAVIAMQFEVTDDAAICFTREFYSAIAAGYPVDAALSESRKAIFAEVSEIEWGTPVLYMRSPDGRIFEMEQVSESARQALQISSLLSAARTSAASDDYADAIQKLKQVLALDAAHAEAAALMREMSARQELPGLYADGRAAADDGRWNEALDRFRRIQAIDPAYRDVQALATQAETALARAADAGRRKAATVVEQPAHEPGETRKAVEAVPASGAATPQRRAGWLFVGGALGAAAAVAILVMGGIGLVLFLAQQQDAPSARTEPPADRTDSAPDGVQRRSLVADPKTGETQPRTTSARETGSPGATRRSTPAAAEAVRRQQVIPSSSAANVASRAQLAAPLVDDPKAQPPVSTAPSSAGYAPAPPPSAPPPVEKNTAEAAPDPGVVTPALRATLEAALRRASDVSAEAVRTLNPRGLSRVFTGDALDENVRIIQLLAGTGVFGVVTLNSRRFGSFSVSDDGRSAEVEVAEVWSANFHSIITKQCMTHFHEHESRETVTLEHSPRGWLVTDVETHTPEPQLVGCH
jgi:hypothetical protein